MPSVVTLIHHSASAPSQELEEGRYQFTYIDNGRRGPHAHGTASGGDAERISVLMGKGAQGEADAARVRR
eukprot:gene4235-6956_t